MTGWQNAILHALARDGIDPSGRKPFGSTMSVSDSSDVTRKDVESVTRFWGGAAPDSSEDDFPHDDT